MPSKLQELGGLLLVLLLLLVAACDRMPTSDGLTTGQQASDERSQAGIVEQSERQSRPPTDGYDVPRIVEDRLHRKIEFTKPPSRIVSLSPATTELLFALGLGDSIVGVTKHCNYPPAALEIARVGSGTLEGISREMIVSVQPELILCQWDNHQPLVETFEKLNIPIFAVGAESLEELFEEARWIGEICDREEAAAELIAAMQARLASIGRTVAAHTASGEKPKRVFYEVWDDPLMSAGPDSFIGELMQLAGLDNIIKDTSRRYPRVSAEIVVQRDPEIILAPTTHFQKVDVSTFASRPGWSEITAVRQKQIFLIDGDQVSRCGPRLLDALQQIVESVYQEAANQAKTVAGGDVNTEPASVP